MSLCADPPKGKDRGVATSIGRAARKARTELGISKEKVAHRVGVSEGFYSRIERGNTLPSVKTLLGISRALNVSADILVGRPSDASRKVEKWTTLRPGDLPEVEAVANKLRGVTPRTLRLVVMLLKELEEGRQG